MQVYLTYPTQLRVVGCVRKVMKPFTFSNGITVPPGLTIGSPILPIHMDTSIYENANSFDGLRFFRLWEQNRENAKHMCVNTNIDFLTFGHGTHAWYLRVMCILTIVLEDFSPSTKLKCCWRLCCCGTIFEPLTACGRKIWNLKHGLSQT